MNQRAEGSIVRRHPLLFFLTASLSLSGCLSHPAADSLYAQRSCETTALAVVPIPPEAGLDLFAESKPDGIVAGAGKGAAAGGLSGLVLAAETGPLFLPLAPILAGGGAVVGSIGGAAWGGFKGTPDATATALRAAVIAGMQDETPDALLDHALRINGQSSSGCAFAPAASQDNSTPATQKLTVTLDQAHLTETGHDSLALELKATTRLTAPSQTEPLATESLTIRGTPLPTAAWLNPDGQAVRRAFEQGFSALAIRIVDRFLLARELPIVPGKLEMDAFCGLLPIAPPASYNFLRMRVDDVPVDSLQPTLSWEAFPGSTRIDDDQQINAVVYDLDIWRAGDDGAEELVYQQRGLTTPTHRLERPLFPQTVYFYSVRSRFLLNGHLRSTLWSASRRPWSVNLARDGRMERSDPCSTTIPTANYLRFTTPDE